ncbi:hypothetical protein F5Y09DRAFT_325786 [Xylaria sp. FL1042]|nr:hypothetical protein F5Y09DRAFT_325786 [Xylaria sp. FL1042]
MFEVSFAAAFFLGLHLGGILTVWSGCNSVTAEGWFCCYCCSLSYRQSQVRTTRGDSHTTSESSDSSGELEWTPVTQSDTLIAWCCSSGR